MIRRGVDAAAVLTAPSLACWWLIAQSPNALIYNEHLSGWWCYSTCHSAVSSNWRKSPAERKKDISQIYKCTKCSGKTQVKRLKVCWFDFSSYAKASYAWNMLVLALKHTDSLCKWVNIQSGVYLFYPQDVPVDRNQIKAKRKCSCWWIPNWQNEDTKLILV